MQFNLKRSSLFSNNGIHSYYTLDGGRREDMTAGGAVRIRILELCKERGITVNKLANMSGVTQSTVNNIVNGRNNSSTVSTIKKLCDGLGMSLADFFNADCFNNLEQELR